MHASANGRGPTTGASLLIATLAAVGCGGEPAPTTATVPAAISDAAFVDRAVELGIVFEHFNGMSGEDYLCEIMGNGGALFDFDNDGDLDLYVTQGSMPGPESPDQAVPPPTEGMLPLRDRLYRNLLIERGSLQFQDVTSEIGLDGTGYGMGVAAGDYDRDGFVDLYVTNFGANVLLHNERGEGFRDVTAASGAGEERWSSSAAFVDYDADGWLDLYVGNYVHFTLANHKHCYADRSEEFYCPPAAYDSVPDRLLHNRGDGSFEDVTATSGIATAFGPTLGVVTADFDHDGQIDIYVANDGQANILWGNRGDGTFEDRALLSGLAYNEFGEAEASMGVDAADYDGDSDTDLFLTHFVDETNTLYVNDGHGLFEDGTATSGLGLPSLPYTGFGTAFFDYDNDGLLDLFVGNGSVTTIPELTLADDPYPFHQKNQLFRNVGGRYVETTGEAGTVFELSEVSRGAAFGDLDNDGDTDVVLLNNSGPARLLVNQIGNRNHWIGLRVADHGGRVDALASVVELVRPDGGSVWRLVRAAGSYLSSNDPRVIVGLAADASPCTVRVHWTDGSVESWQALPPDTYHTLRRGEGRAAS